MGWYPCQCCGRPLCPLGASDTHTDPPVPLRGSWQIDLGAAGLTTILGKPMGLCCVSLAEAGFCEHLAGLWEVPYNPGTIATCVASPWGYFTSSSPGDCWWYRRWSGSDFGYRWTQCFSLGVGFQWENPLGHAQPYDWRWWVTVLAYGQTLGPWWGGCCNITYQQFRYQGPLYTWDPNPAVPADPHVADPLELTLVDKAEAYSTSPSYATRCSGDLPATITATYQEEA